MYRECTDKSDHRSKRFSVFSTLFFATAGRCFVSAPESPEDAYVGHHHVSVDLATRLVGTFVQSVQVSQIIVIVEEIRLAIVSPLHDVGRHSSNIETRFSRYGIAPQYASFVKGSLA